MLRKLWKWIYKYDLEIVVIPLLLIIVLATMCIAPMLISNYFTCQANSVNLELDTRWNIWGGCYYNLDGVWYTGDVASDILRQQYQFGITEDSLDFLD